MPGPYFPVVWCLSLASPDGRVQFRLSLGGKGRCRARGLGSSTADFQAARERRLRLDHRGRARTLQRHGARRKGDTWFLAVTNGPYARTVRVDLAFLDRGSYKSMLIRDRAEAADVKIEHLTLSRSDSLYIDLRSGGGFVGRFMK